MTEDLSDKILFKEIEKGNSIAISTLFKRYYQQLCRFMFVFIPENEIVEELTANVFINLWENRKRIVIQTSLKAYLYKSAKNQAFSYLRKNKNEFLSLEEDFNFLGKREFTPEDIYIENELKLEFVKAFQKLPPRAKLAFKLHRMDGLKYAEVAEIMNITVPAVEKNITSALKILHKQLVQMTNFR